MPHGIKSAETREKETERGAPRQYGQSRMSPECATSESVKTEKRKDSALVRNLIQNRRRR